MAPSAYVTARELRERDERDAEMMPSGDDDER